MLINVNVCVLGVGCADPSVSGQMTLRRDSAVLATLTCNMTGQSWTLTCADTEWVGERGNCTRGRCPILKGQGYSNNCNCERNTSVFFPCHIMFCDREYPVALGY